MIYNMLFDLSWRWRNVSVTCSRLCSWASLLHRSPGWSGSPLLPCSLAPAGLRAASVPAGLQISQRGADTTARSPDRGRCGAGRTYTHFAHFLCYNVFPTVPISGFRMFWKSINRDLICLYMEFMIFIYSDIILSFYIKTKVKGLSNLV